MDRCFNCVNLLTCFNIDRYRDALCKIGNECITTIDTVNSSLVHTPAIRTAAKFPFYCRFLLANKDTNLRSRWELHSQC